MKFNKLTKSIQGKFFLITVGLLGTCLIILGSIIYNNSSKNQYKTTHAFCTQIVQARASEIGEMLNGMVSEIQRISENSEIQSMDWSKAENVLAATAEKRKNSYSLLFLIYPDGSYYSPKKGKNDKNLKERDYFKAVMHEGKPFAISNPSLSKSTGEKKFTIAVPIKKTTGEICGCLAANVSLKNLSAFAESIKIGESGFGYIIDNEGIFVAHPDESLLLSTNIKKTDSLGYEGLQTVGEEMLKGQIGSQDIVNPNKSKSLYVYSQIPHSPQWSLGITIPHEEIYESVHLFTKFLTISFILVLFILILSIRAMANKMIIKPITGISIILKDIAQGRLYNDIEYKSEDEIGQMADDLRSMQLHLKTIAAEIRVGVMQIEESSSQLSGAAEQISSGASEQAASTEEVSASIEEMGATTGQNAQNAGETEKIAVLAAGEISKVKEAVERSVESMQTIAEKVIIINEIAEKTDILAINAAIEAARAGESGKGFAVVADEVRKLAERSRIAAEEINVISNESVEVAKTSFELLTTVIPNVEKTSTLVKEIANSSAEQSQGIDQINSAIVQLTNVTQQNSTASEELAAHAHQLADEAKNLTSVISYLQLQQSDNSQHKINKEPVKKNDEVKKTTHTPKPTPITSKRQTATLPKQSHQNKTEGFTFKMGEHTDTDFESIT